MVGEPTELMISMSREGLQAFAERLQTACTVSAHGGGGVEVELEAEYNGTGPNLLLRFDNDDMEDRDDVGPDTAYWEPL